MNNIGIEIQKARKEKKFTQLELAKLMNVSPKTISKWECGQTSPDLENILKLSEILEINLSNSSVMIDEKAETNNLGNQKLFYSIILCLLFCLLELIIYYADVVPKIAYVIFGAVFCIFVMLDAICYK